MNVRGERILILGDSLTHPGLDSAPTVQDITRGSDRPSSAPGDLLGSILLEQGAAAVRTNAKVGRSAVSFFAHEPAAQLLEADRAWKPTKIVIMLGANDAERDLAKTEAAMIQLRDIYRLQDASHGMGAEVWAIGPMTYVGRGASLNDKAATVLGVMQRVFGKARTIDARALSTGAERAGDGIHFTQAGARATASQLASVLVATRAINKPVMGLVIGFVGILAIGLVAWSIKRRKLGMIGMLVEPKLVGPMLMAYDAKRSLKAGNDNEDLDWDAPSWERHIDEKRAKKTAEVKAALKTSPAIIANDGRNEWLLIASGEMHESERGRFRVTTFGDDGPIGHEVKDSMEDVAKEIASGHGYKSVRPATDAEVMTWTSTPKFIEGSKRVAFVQAANMLHFRAGKKDAHDRAREIEMRAHKLASDGKWDDAVILLQQGVKELSGIGPGELPPEVIKKWKRAISAYQKAIKAIEAGNDDITHARRARDRLRKIRDEAAGYAPQSYKDPIVVALDTEESTLPKIADAQDRGREVRYRAREAEIKRLREEEREVQRPYDWMKR